MTLHPAHSSWSKFFPIVRVLIPLTSRTINFQLIWRLDTWLLDLRKFRVESNLHEGTHPSPKFEMPPGGSDGGPIDSGPDKRSLYYAEVKLR